MEAPFPLFDILEDGPKSARIATESAPRKLEETAKEAPSSAQEASTSFRRDIHGLPEAPEITPEAPGT
eukprot:4864166-Pyramimonas_sp.AAC.1